MEKLSACLTGLLFGVATASGTSPVLAQEARAPTPTFSSGQEYSRVSRQLARDGWQFWYGGDNCRGDSRCGEYMEAITCGVGARATCWMGWTKNGRYLLVRTEGENVIFMELHECGAIEVIGHDPARWCHPPAPFRPGARRPPVQGPPEGDIETRALSNVNIRSGPGTNFRIVGQMSAGERLWVDGMMGDWCVFGIPEDKYIRCDLLAPPRGGWVAGVTVQRLTPGTDWGD